MSQLMNKQWIMTSRPADMVARDNFKFQEVPVPELKDGEMLVKNLYMSFDPTLRAWMNERDTYVKAIAIGEVMRCNAVGEVVESKLDGFEKGDRVMGGIGWQEYCVTTGENIMPFQKVPTNVPPTMPLSILGITGLTAYFGMLDVADLKEGQTVVVSGAAGATGSVAAQIAKLKGCTVIGIAGGPVKSKFLTEELGLDHAIDYKNDDVKAKLKEYCPKGIDRYFDNVGGPILDMVLDRIALKGKVVLCGAISDYNSKDVFGPKNYTRLIVMRGSMQGFIILDYAKRFPEAIAGLSKWVMEGKIKFQEDLQEGLENAPEAFQRIFTGKNIGKQLLKVADPAS
ncbi:MAG: NADP-dependent oxidoreductase [Gammaproteobacteria bacterium]|nr:NADP-dependent oxidoreductase [Gammaproteobacteria bacterium]